MVSSGTDKSNEVIMEINQALKQHLRIFQFSENILAVVFLRIIKFYLFQVTKRVAGYQCPTQTPGESASTKLMC